MAYLINILVFTLAAPAAPAAPEWEGFDTQVDWTNDILRVTLSIADPTYAYPALP
jgi:hypothetical protein